MHSSVHDLSLLNVRSISISNVTVHVNFLYTKPFTSNFSLAPFFLKVLFLSSHLQFFSSGHVSQSIPVPGGVSLAVISLQPNAESILGQSALALILVAMQLSFVIAASST